MAEDNYVLKPPVLSSYLNCGAVNCFPKHSTAHHTKRTRIVASERSNANEMNVIDYTGSSL